MSALVARPGAPDRWPFREIYNAMTYKAPLADIAFALKYGASFSSAIDQGLFGELTMDDVDAVLTEAARFAE